MSLYEDERPVHRPAAYDAPIPGRHWYSGCEPGGDFDPETLQYEGHGPLVGEDGFCRSCGAKACPDCGAEFYPDGGCQCPAPTLAEKVDKLWPDNAAYAGDEDPC